MQTLVNRVVNSRLAWIGKYCGNFGQKRLELQAVRQLLLRESPASSLGKKIENEKELQRKQQQGARYIVFVFLPRARLAVHNDGSGRQVCFGKTPALQLIPIDNIA